MLKNANFGSIRGSISVRYNPSNPSTGFEFTCEDAGGRLISDAIWTRENGHVYESLVINGQLILNEDSIGTESPQINITATTISIKANQYYSMVRQPTTSSITI